MGVQVKATKLIAGQMNVLLTKCPVGYAEGVEKPKPAIKAKPFNPVIVLRKAAPLKIAA
jgi:hypothetical protein